MISIIQQSSCQYGISLSGQTIGWVTVSLNPFHNRNRYISLHLDQYDPDIARELFPLLRKELGYPLQIMLCPTEQMHNFLISGGFVRKRRCYTLEISPGDLSAPVHSSGDLPVFRKGSGVYAACCGLLYDYYRATHEAVSPLTVAQDAFCSQLPDTVICSLSEGKPTHYAFVEPDGNGYEIAYVGTASVSSFPDFARSLVSQLFRKCNFLTMECDDTDPAAMAVKALFRSSDEQSFDTYILK